jgi:hypothetical protein
MVNLQNIVTAVHMTFWEKSHQYQSGWRLGEPLIKHELVGAEKIS